MQVEWRKAVRERSYKISHDCRRHQRLDGEQLKKRLYFEVLNTDSVMGQLKREQTQMEERLSRYNNEREKIKSQQLLRHMDGGAGSCCEQEAAGEQQQRHHHHQPMSFEIVVQAPSEVGDEEPEADPAPVPPIFVSKLPRSVTGDGGGSGDGSSRRRSVASADGQMFELTESEDELLSDFLDRQRLSDEAASSTGGGGNSTAATPRVRVNGLSLEQFMKKCRSRHLMDSAIERAETFVDEWQESEGINDGGSGALSGSNRRLRRTPRRKLPLEEPKEAPAAPPAGEASGQKVEELEKIERDFKTLLQEAKKARYLRGRNAEIVERDRELTTDEIFQSARPL